MSRLLLFTLFVCLSATGLVAAPLVSAAADDSPEEEFVYPQMQNSVFLTVPLGLRHLSSSWGAGRVRLRIGLDGTVDDWIPIDLPHYQLVQTIDRALAGARFIPASIDGEPVAVDVPAMIPLVESLNALVISETLMEHIESLQARIVPQATQLTVSLPGDLDQPLALESFGETYQVVDENGQSISGTVTIQFYVDTEGTPRMLRTAADTDSDLAEAAVKTVSQFRFNKPTRKGRPTIVRARIPVVIGP